MDKSLVVILFGSSGSGKSTYKKFLISNSWNDIKSYTTRNKRKDESDEYHFISNIEWLSLTSANKMINCNNYHGSYYGVLLEDLKKKEPSVLISDITSLEELRKQLIFLGKKVIIVFCDSPKDLEVLRKRHLDRGTQNRLKISKKEIKDFEKEKESDWWKKNIHHSFTSLEDAERFIRELNL